MSWSNKSNGESNPYTEVVAPHVPLAQDHCQEQDKVVVRAHEKKTGEGYHWEVVEDHEKLDCMTDAPEEVSGVVQELGAPAT